MLLGSTNCSASVCAQEYLFIKQARGKQDAVDWGCFEAGATNVVWYIHCRESSNIVFRDYLGWRE